MKREEIRRSLIEGTIRVVAREGLDKATTKLLATEAGVNEVYIYRFFEGKEDLFASTFSKLDNELISKILNHLPIMEMTELDIVERCRLLFDRIWKYLLSNSDEWLCYTRYYYSPYFKKYSFEKHRRNYDVIVKVFEPAFVEGSDVWMILHSIMHIMLTSAVKVFQDDFSDNEKTAEHVFSLIYSGIKDKLVWTK